MDVSTLGSWRSYPTRIVGPLWLGLLLVPSFASIALAAPPAIVERDEGLIVNVYFSGKDIVDDEDYVPIPIEDRIYYCDVARVAAEEIWKATHEQHKIWKFNFHDGWVPPHQILTGPLRWYHKDGSSGGVKSEYGEDELFPGFIRVYDETEGCAPKYTIDPDTMELTWPLECVHDPSLPCVIPPVEAEVIAGTAVPMDWPLSHDNNGEWEIRRSLCVEDGHSIRKDAERMGWTLAHELGHLVYGLDDEYVSPSETGIPYGVCVGDPDENNGTDETSMMAAHGRSHWCDEETHFHDRPLEVGGVEVLVAALGNTHTVTVGNASTHDVWNYLLANSHPYWLKYPLSHSTESYDLVDPFPGVDPMEFCHWTTPEVAHFINDAMFIVDKSLSMDYVDPDFEDGPTAFEAAYATAQTMFLTLDPNYSGGIVAYDTETHPLIAYGTPNDPAPDFPDIEAGGNTDICGAIADSKEAIMLAEMQDQSPSASGQQILISDGLPTVNGCETDESVIQAAMLACMGDFEVVTHTLALGNADADLLKQVAEACGGVSGRSMTLPSPGGLTAPLALSSGIARLGNYTRGLQEVAFTNDRVHEPRTDFVFVPAGSTQLALRWFGDGFEYIFFNDEEVLDCEMDTLDFFLLSPSGVSYPISVDGELARTAIVENPESGFWRAVIVPQTSFVCTAEGSDADPDTPEWGEHDPRVTSIAAIRNSTYSTELWTDADTVGRDRPVKIFGRLRYALEPVLDIQSIVAIAPASGGTIELLALNDEGNDGDVNADDGIYTATFNPGGALLPVADNYIVRGQFLSLTGVSHTRPFVPDHSSGGATPGESLDVPDALLNAESSFTIAGCTGPSCFVEAVVPTPGSADGPCSVRPPVGTTTELTIETEGLRLIEGLTSVYLVPGVDTSVSNVQILSYDEGTRAGLVSFDATLTDQAVDVPRRIVVEAAGRSIDSLTCDDEGGEWGVPGSCLSDPSVEHCCEDDMVLIEGTSNPDQLLHDPLEPIAACMLGYEAADLLRAEPLANHLMVGGPGNDLLLSNGGDDRIVGNSGLDVVYSGNGLDAIFAGEHADIVFGDGGDDRLDGESGNDILVGGRESDTIEGDVGDDLILGLTNSDFIFPGAGADAVDAGWGDDRVQIRARCELGDKFLNGGPGTDTLILPVTLAQAQSEGVVVINFENVLENVVMQVESARCE